MLKKTFLYCRSLSVFVSVGPFQAHFLKVCFSKLLIQQCVALSSLSIDVTGLLASGNLESTCEREICFVKKQRESLNSICLSLVPLADRYPDNKVCLPCKPSLEIRVFSPNIKRLSEPPVWAPLNSWQSSCRYRIPYITFAGTGHNPICLFGSFCHISFNSMSSSMLLYFCLTGGLLWAF